MFLKHIPTGDLVEVLDLTNVINPNSSTIRARAYIGERTSRPEDFEKADLAFPSDEPLPLCWVDRHYHEHIAA